MTTSPLSHDDAFASLLFDHAVLLSKDAIRARADGILSACERAQQQTAFQAIDDLSETIQQLRIERVILLSALERARNELTAAGRILVAEDCDRIIGQAYGRTK